ncbi:MAG: hypothetical protein ACE3L7_19745 [Candidatus Pristimantibacillus sp.]
MKSKRAMIERRNIERRVRREQKKNPPGPFFKLFDGIWKMVFMLFLLSLIVVAICHWFVDTDSGSDGTKLIPFVAERMATLMLFLILTISCAVGIKVMIKPPGNSRVHKQQDGGRVKLMKFALLLFFAFVITVSAIICIAQLKALAEVWQSLLS